MRDEKVKRIRLKDKPLGAANFLNHGLISRKQVRPSCTSTQKEQTGSIPNSQFATYPARGASRNSALKQTRLQRRAGVRARGANSVYGQLSWGIIGGIKDPDRK